MREDRDWFACISESIVLCGRQLVGLHKILMIMSFALCGEVQGGYWIPTGNFIDHMERSSEFGLHLRLQK